MSTQINIDDHMKGSSLVYFKPTQAFFDFFLRPEWKYRRFHDCGAGMGTLTRAMRGKKLDCLAYDLHPREASVVEVQKLNTKDIADYMDTSDVVLIARPCHHPDFIEVTLHSALEMGEAFYIGKPERLGEDLIQFWYDVVARDVGEAGEVLVRVRCDLDKHYTYRKLESPSILGREEWWWYNPVRKRYTSDPTGLAGFDASDFHGKVLEEVLLANDLQAMSTKAVECKDDSLAGWLAPDGTWFGCGYAQHDYIARAVLGCSTARLERLGFARCHGDEGTGRPMMIWKLGDGDSPGCKPTPAQKRVLKAKGYDPNQ